MIHLFVHKVRFFLFSTMKIKLWLGWKRFTINSSKIPDSWPILYLGIQNSFAPLILASSLPILSYRYLTYQNRESIYLSTNIEHIAQPKFTPVWKKILNDDDGKNVYYQFILQCRINPKLEYFSNDKRECIIPAEQATLENICNQIFCFGLMIRVTDVEPIQWIRTCFLHWKENFSIMHHSCTYLFIAKEKKTPVKKFSKGLLFILVLIGKEYILSLMT